MSVATLRVDMPATDGGAYDAVVCRGEDPAPLLRALVTARFGTRPRFLLADAEVAARLPYVRAALDDPPMILVTSGEAAKNLAEVERAASALVDAGVDRSAVLFALGGGALGDVAGFVAATLLRGLDYVHLPTTLTAMTDSSIGGKTAINLPRGKNLVGAFHQPRLVFCDVGALATLAPRDRAAGLGEVLKHALLDGEDALLRIERDAERLRDGPAEGLFEVVCHAIDFKARVVAADPRERQPPAVASARPVPLSGRITLNLGHSVGHALEAASHATETPLRHGEAVGLGLYAEAVIGAQVGLWRYGPARVGALLPRLGLPASLAAVMKTLSVEGVRSALIADKKRAQGRVRFVLLDAPGRPMALSLDGDRALEILLSEKIG